MVTATNLAGEYGVNGVGIFQPGETKEIPLDVAVRLRERSEFRLNYDASDLPLRDERGAVKYLEYFGPVDSRFGYGGAGITILRALTKLGVNTFVNPHYNNSHTEIYRKDLPDDAAQHLGNKPWLAQVALVHCLPPDLERCKAPRKVAWTMWETSKIPDGSPIQDVRWKELGNWVKLLNENAEHVVVPCLHNKEVFENCGVKLPVTVLPYGLDTDVWPLQDRPERDTFTVTQYGDLTTRKGTEEVILAFQQAFPNQIDVRLVLKTQGPLLARFVSAVYGKDPRITVISDTFTREQLVNLLYHSDCFIWLSRGEGFGLPPLQAALTGLPVITTTHSGMGAYYKPQFFYGVQSTGTSPSPLGGEWYEPSVDHAAQQLRTVYENRKAATKRGKAAATYTRNSFSLNAFTERLGAFLDTL